MGRLERKLDEDLIDRILSGWTPPDKKASPAKMLVKPRKKPRSWKTYRGARMNVQKHGHTYE